MITSKPDKRQLSTFWFLPRIQRRKHGIRIMGNTINQPLSPPLCKCGCGEPVTASRKYLRGHAIRRFEDIQEPTGNDPTPEEIKAHKQDRGVPAPYWEYD